MFSLFKPFPFLFCQSHEMLCADIAQRRGLAFFCMMKAETAFLHHSARLCIAVIITAPDGSHSQILKTSLQQATHGFGYQTLSPIRPAYPVSYLRLIFLHFGTVQTIPEHDTYAPDRFTCFFQDNSISFRSGKDSTDDVQAVFYGRVRWPTCNRTDCRILSVFI